MECLAWWNLGLVFVLNTLCNSDACGPLTVLWITPSLNHILQFHLLGPTASAAPSWNSEIARSKWIRYTAFRYFTTLFHVVLGKLLSLMDFSLLINITYFVTHKCNAFFHQISNWEGVCVSPLGTALTSVCSSGLSIPDSLHFMGLIFWSATISLCLL